MSGSVTERRTPGRTGWVVLAIVAGNLLIDTVEVSSFFVALPTLVTDLGMSVDDMVLLSATFPAAFAVGIPLAQPIAARVGAHRLFVCALLAFAAFSLLAVLSSSVALIALARLVKGLAAGLTTPLGNGVIGAAFASEADRHRAGKLYSLVGGVGFIAGMAVTAPLVTADWRAGISWTAPVAVVLAIAAATLLPAGIGAVGTKTSTVSRTMRLVMGGTTASIALALSPVPPWLQLTATVTAVLVMVAGTGIGAHAALSPGATRPFVVNALTAGAFNALFLAFFATAQLLLHRVGFDTVEACLMLSPVALGMACATPLTGWVSRVLSPTSSIAGAVLLSALAYVWFGTYGTDDRTLGPLVVLGMATLIGLAFVLGFVALNMRAVSFALPAQQSTALSFYQVLVQSGAALTIPMVAGTTAVFGREPVAGWPLPIAVGGVGLCVLGTYIVLAHRRERSQVVESKGVRT